jgi:hypothetical protein
LTKSMESLPPCRVRREWREDMECALKLNQKHTSLAQITGKLQYNGYFDLGTAWR